MTQTNLTIQTKELISHLYSSDEYLKKEAIYRILFDRRSDLLPELKKAVKYEENEQIAVFMVQVSLTLSSFPRNYETEKLILELLQNSNGRINSLTPLMWEYLETSATSKMIIAILACMGNSVPPNSFEFIEMCLAHPDPDVRATVCEKALNSGRPSHFAYVLNLVTDKDPVVSQTAFMAIKNMPASELSIILDYSLGSPDEWVLNTVAPFLPKLINNSLRTIIAKVQYHSNPNVARKAREALKLLDATPHKSRYRREIERQKVIEKEDKKDTIDEKIFSIKAQLDQKRKEQEEKERAIKEANEALERELSNVDQADMEDFEKAIDDFDAVFPMSEEEKNNKKEEKIFAENTDFSYEKNTLANIDEKESEEAFLEIDKQQNDELPVDNVKEIPRTDSDEINKEDISLSNEFELEKETLDYGDNKLESSDSNDNDLSKCNNTEELLDQDMLDLINMDSSYYDDIDESVTAKELSDNEDFKNNENTDYSDLDFANMDFASLAESINDEQKENSISNFENSQTTDVSDNTDYNKGSFDNLLEKSEEHQDNLESVTFFDYQPNEIQNSNIIEEITQNNVSEKTEDNVSDINLNAIESKKQQPNNIQKQITKVIIPANSKEIIDKYPSFITDPLLEVFKANTNQEKLKTIDKVLNNLMAFLNLCFLQTAMFYAHESEILTKSIKDCIKGNLTGPSDIRWLHNFVLALKTVRNNNNFFTFALSQILSLTNETSPLMLIRELKDFLRAPEESLEESIPMAIDGLIEILKGVRAITTNALIMRAPNGAKLPYADLSGPVAKALSEDKRPSLDLPVGEVILISTDGSEALGLYPFFKYLKKKIFFSIPTKEELATFYERLEIIP